MFNEYQVGYFNQVKEEFEALHPDVGVEIQRVTGGSWTDFEIALLNDFWSKNAPDVARISDITLARLIATGMLDEAPPEVVENLNSLMVSESLKDVLRRGDKTYGTIHAATWQGIYYNKDHFIEAGLDPDKPPTTWDEVIEYAGKLTKYDEKGNVTRAGISLRKEGYGPGIAMKFYDFLFSAGGGLYDKEKKHSLLNNKAAVDTLQFYMDILYKYRYDGFEVVGDFDGFVNGSVSMFCRGPWVIKALHDKAPHINWGVGHIPAKVKSSSNGGTYPLVVASDSPEKELAWEFALFLMAPERIVPYNRNEMYTPYVPEAAALPEFAENEAYQSYLTQPNVIPVTIVPRMNEIETMAGTTIEDVVRNNKNPKKELDALVAKIDRILAEEYKPPRPSVSPEPFAWGVIVALGLGFAGYIGWWWRRERWEKMAYLFLLPFIIYFAVFFIYPIISSLILSFWDYNPVAKDTPFVGLGNYGECMRDEAFLKSLWNTIAYAFWTVAIGVVLSLGLAMALNRAMSGIGVYRTLYFLPVVASLMGTVLVWKFLYRPDDLGLLNRIIEWAGADKKIWLLDESLALPCLIALGVWKSLGFNMLLFLAGLKAIPPIYEEAAAVDGAGPWQRFWHVILPSLRPTLLFVVVTSLITAFQVFTQVVGMTEGGPNNATRTIVYHIYEIGFKDFRLGYASAAAVFMLIIVGLITYIQMRVIRE
jgi:ABC-type sugar transport system permease subunit/ABC-type glycerol-3-phosphate transport system substrate-binding protein